MLIKASAASLVLVPVLAFSWSGVNAVARGYRDRVRRATHALESAHARLEDSVGEWLKREEKNRVIPLLDEIEREIEVVLSACRVVDSSPGFPGGLVWAFAAALFVVMARTLYQVSVPAGLRGSQPENGAAAERPILACGTIVLYLAGFASAVWILALQCHLVLESAGWLDPNDWIPARP